MIRRTLACALFVALTPAGPPVPRAQPSQPTGSFELDEVTVTQLQDAMAAGRYTSRRLVELYTERINEIDRSGPALRSVIELNPDALAIADALDAERQSGPRARAAARHPGPDQGQHRHRRPDDDDRRLAGARGLDRRARCVRRRRGCAPPAR